MKRMKRRQDIGLIVGVLADRVEPMSAREIMTEALDCMTGHGDNVHKRKNIPNTWSIGMLMAGQPDLFERHGPKPHKWSLTEEGHWYARGGY